MSEEQINDLVQFDPSRFNRREYAALSWVRAFLTSPSGVPEEIDVEFQSVLATRDREYVMAAMKGMFCVNLGVNTNRHLRGIIRRSPDGEPATACRVELLG